MARQHPIRDAGLALSLLTVVPTTAKWPEEGRPQAAAWFPAVGALLGIVGYTIVHLAHLVGVEERAPLVVAAVVVIAWGLLTRMLHWDGLADVGDAFWGSHDASRRLEIMSDSHTGAFGATSVALVALLEVAAIGSIVATPHELPLLLVPVFARFTATAGAWLARPARASGLGRSVMGRPTWLSFFIAAVTVGLAWIGMGVGFHAVGAALGAFAIVIALSLPRLLGLRFGGVTGDVLGASVIVTEVLLFAAFALIG